MRGEHLNCEPSPLAPLAPLLRGPLKTLTVILNQFLDDPSWLVPAPPLSADHVSVSMELRFGAVMIAEAALSFYDCVAVTLLRPSAP